MEEEIKELLGENYKDGMTKDEINEAFRKHFVSTGMYENKDKVDAERKANSNKIADLEKQLKAKMSDDEISQKEFNDMKKMLAQYQENERTNKINTSKIIAENKLSEIKTLLEVKDTDKEFVEFISNISSEDNEQTTKTSTYIMNLIKKAYEKGKAESVKNDLGDLGKNFVMNNDGKTTDTLESFVKNLAKGSIAPTNKLSNFN
jgi:hypothetical protein